MPGQVSVTFRGFTPGLLTANLGAARRFRFPDRAPPGIGEETLLRAGLEALSLVSTARGPAIHTLLGLAAPPVSSLRLSGVVPGAFIRLPSPDFTITYGLSAGAAAIYAFSVGAGVYFWYKMPGSEVGVYGSMNIGMMSNVGASAGVPVAVLFDKAPVVLAGNLITISIDIDIPPVTVGGHLFLTAPPVTMPATGPLVTTSPASRIVPGASVHPRFTVGAWTPEIVGIGFMIGVGVSALPVSLAVMPGRTWIRPVRP